MRGSKRFVYIIRSRADPRRYYTGLTSDVTARLGAHNAGLCRHTATATSWEPIVAIEFADESRAVAFEKYLKSDQVQHSRSVTCADRPSAWRVVARWDIGAENEASNG